MTRARAQASAWFDGSKNIPSFIFADSMCARGRARSQLPSFSARSDPGGNTLQALSESVYPNLWMKEDRLGVKTSPHLDLRNLNAQKRNID